MGECYSIDYTNYANVRQWRDVKYVGSMFGVDPLGYHGSSKKMFLKVLAMDRNNETRYFDVSCIHEIKLYTCEK